MDAHVGTRARRSSKCDGLQSYFGSADGLVRAVDGVSFAIARGRGARPGRRIGLRQEHHRPRLLRLLDRTAGQVLYRGDDIGELPGDAHAASCAAAADHLPGPLRQPQPAHAHRRHHRRGARHARPGARPAAHASGASPSCSSWSACAPNMRGASRTNSPAASASASASPARSPSSRSSSSPTSRSRRSTCRSRRRCSTCCADLRERLSA